MLFNTRLVLQEVHGMQGKTEICLLLNKWMAEVYENRKRIEKQTTPWNPSWLISSEPRIKILYFGGPQYLRTTD